ncbi:hypothetical protein IE53DRAFT_296880, partial [Violaceomyces palustris]
PSSNVLRTRRSLLIQYHSRIQPRSRGFRWPEGKDLLQVQTHLYQDLYDGDRTAARRSFPASDKYDKSFLKELLKRLEESIQRETERLSSEGRQEEASDLELEERFLSRYSNLMGRGASFGPGVDLPPDSEYVTYHWRVPRPSLDGSGSADGGNDKAYRDALEGFQSVTIREQGISISRGTTGLKTWEASLRLAAHIVRSSSGTTHHPDRAWNDHDVTRPGTRVLELGSGVGLLGCVVSALQVRKATTVVKDQEGQGKRRRRREASLETVLTDVPGQVLDRLQETLEINSLRSYPSCRVQGLDWLKVEREGEEEREREEEEEGFYKPNLILAADVVYDPDLVGPLASTIKACLSSGRPSTEDTAAPMHASNQLEQELQPKALVASTVRNPKTYELFLQHLTSKGMAFEKLPDPSASPSSPDDQGDLPLFPSSHDPNVDGHVELIRITL